MQVLLENLSDLPQEVFFYPLPKEVTIDNEMIPIFIFPKEKFAANLIYRSQQTLTAQVKKDEGHLKCKIITGTISTRELKIPYECEIMKCALEFSALKIDMPAL